MAVNKSPLLTTLRVQLSLLLPVFVLSLFWDKRIAISILLGAMVFVLPNLLFTLYTFRYRGAANAADIYRSFKFGELVKLVLTTIGFALVFQYAEQINILAFFAAFVAMVVLQAYIAGKRLAKTI